MSQFEIAIGFVLPREGGLSENPNDGGGITNYGISLRFLREIDGNRLKKYGIFEPITYQTIRDLTIEQAKLIYRGEFWESASFGQIESQTLCNYIFDMCVNHGIAQGIKLVQRACWAAALTRNSIKDDGILGEKTLEAINSFDHDLLSILVAIRASFCRLLGEIRPKDKVFLDGWLNRCYDAI